MGIDGITIKEAEFWDKDTNQSIKVDLSVRDIIFFKLLERIEASLSRK